MVRVCSKLQSFLADLIYTLDKFYSLLVQGQARKPTTFGKIEVSEIISMLEANEVVGVDTRLASMVEAVLSKGLADVPSAMMAINGKLEPLDVRVADSIMAGYQTELQEIQMSVRSSVHTYNRKHIS